MNTKSFAVMVVIACLTPLCFVSGFAYGQDVPETNKKSEITYDVIKEAWLARQKTYSGAKFSLVQDVKRLKLGDALGMNPVPNEIDPATAAKLANAYDEYQEEIQISIAGSRIHYYRNGMMAVAVKGKIGLYPGKAQEAFDGRVGSFFNDKNGGIPYPHAHIDESLQSTAELMIDFGPIVWVFGNLDRRLLAQLENADVKMTLTDAILDSRSCVVLKTTGTGPRRGQFMSYWLDPSKDYAIVRYTSDCGKNHLQLDCSYVQNREGYWMPTEWATTAKFGDVAGYTDSPSYIVHTKVQESIVNPTFAQDEFTIKFPPGTLVSDARPQSRPSSGGEGCFIVEKDGRQRIASPKDVSVLVKEADQWMRFHSGWTLCCCILIGLLTCIFFLRRRLRLKNA